MQEHTSSSCPGRCRATSVTPPPTARRFTLRLDLNLPRMGFSLTSSFFFGAILLWWRELHPCDCGWQLRLLQISDVKGQQ
jgi:hypothetical protein